MEKWKYKFNQNLKTSMDIGEITPIYWDTLYPGESYKKLNFKNLTRMITPIYPTLDNPKIELYAFAVPKRILMDENPHMQRIPDSINLMLSKETIEELQNFPDNDVLINRNSIVKDSDLLMKFGLVHSQIMPKDNAQPRKIKLNYILAYWKIYEQFFKQKQIEVFNYNEFFRKLTFNGLATELDLDPEKIKLNNPALEEIINNTEDASIIEDEIKNALNIITKIAKGNTNNEYLNELTFQEIKTNISKDWNTFKETLSNNYIKNKMILDKVNTGTIKDELISVWNANNNDKTSPILLGYEEFEQGIDQVINQTAPRDSNAPALGEIGGMSVKFSQGNLINNYTANEETIIMVLALPTYKMSINTSFEIGEWDPEKVYNPEMEYLQDERKIDFISSLYWREQIDKNKIIGYIPPFNWLRKKKDVIAGQIIDTWNNWTYTLDLENEEQLEQNNGNPNVSDKLNNSIKEINTNLLKIRKKPFKDTLVSPEQDSFICEYLFNAETLRTIKPYEIIEQETLEGE